MDDYRDGEVKDNSTNLQNKDNTNSDNQTNPIINNIQDKSNDQESDNTFNINREPLSKQIKESNL